MSESPPDDDPRLRWTELEVDPNRIIEGGLRISVAGHFNPLIFHPAWLQANNLISADDHDIATAPAGSLITTAALSSWSTPSFDLDVSLTEFSITTANENFESQLIDLTIGLFTLLPHTPVTEIVVERYVHLRVSEPQETELGKDPLPDVRRTLGSSVNTDLWNDVLPGAYPDIVSMIVTVDGTDLEFTVQPSAQATNAIYVSALERVVLGHSSDAGEDRLDFAAGELASVLPSTAGTAAVRTQHLTAVLIRRLLRA